MGPQSNLPEVAPEIPLEMIIVGVDVGLTCTGVAFCTPDMIEPSVISTWPGSDEIAHKVPTAVGYRAGVNGVASWGFSCPSPGTTGPGIEVKECFKLYLDRANLEEAFRDRPKLAPGTFQDVQKWFRDFLAALYYHIEDYFDNYFGPKEWSSSKVEYIFSVPTTWSDPAVVEAFREVIKDAGFGKGERHSVAVGLTEAEAAAVYTAKNGARKRAVNDPDAGGVLVPPSPRERHAMEADTLLICDAGGGTTDICILKVVSVKKTEEGEIAELGQLDFVEGEAIGSVEIDEAFEREVERRLKLVRTEVPHVPGYAAHDVAKGHFQHVKSVFGTSLGDLDIFPFRVPGLSREFSSLEARVESGRMIFTSDEIKQMFDTQIRRIFGVIDKQLVRLRQLKPSEQVSHFILSGGLCSSQYVQDRIFSRYGKGAQGGEILISDEPQLAVCKGLVIDRIHRLKHGTSILSTRCCRASYGILFNEMYDKKSHSKQQRTPLRSPLDGRKYATGQIYWLIRQGEAAKRDERIRHKFYRIVDSESPDTKWKDTIAISRSPPDRLPSSIHEGDAQPVCEIESDLGLLLLSTGMDGVKRKQKRWLGIGIGKTFLVIEYEVVVSIGPADLRFEIRFGGKTVGKEEAIPVKWMYTHDLGEGNEKGDEEAKDNKWYSGPVACRW